MFRRDEVSPPIEGVSVLFVLNFWGFRMQHAWQNISQIAECLHLPKGLRNRHNSRPLSPSAIKNAAAGSLSPLDRSAGRLPKHPSQYEAIFSKLPQGFAFLFCLISNPVIFYGQACLNGELYWWWRDHVRISWFQRWQGGYKAPSGDQTFWAEIGHSAHLLGWAQNSSEILIEPRGFLNIPDRKMSGEISLQISSKSKPSFVTTTNISKGA